MLNRLFSRMTEVIRQHSVHRQIHGRLRHGFWGSVQRDEHATQAVRAALGMKMALDKINAGISGSR